MYQSFWKHHRIHMTITPAATEHLHKYIKWNEYAYEYKSICLFVYSCLHVCAVTFSRLFFSIPLLPPPPHTHTQPAHTRTKKKKTATMTIIMKKERKKCVVQLCENGDAAVEWLVQKCNTSVCMQQKKIIEEIIKIYSLIIVMTINIVTIVKHTH
ncbi:T. brucei spp.-specific protein [Trypanosoma brucei gambiense DAL972]|uniref:T. brucei spp.-specific protein n=1 Tax=Trypanosoma brucei gambiense (strain MHOM/CI/86/DAL972) TaxID=679716 RepID=D0A653_TRYB9|nr:T. brucei spp.-specific protein [Trypanosoma brucei gambiense DAL972]CBH17154.1 T. brucei spp.-specific protein [Trypanosoma brucei gambiense DAL972]|eukprot:XP_011779418.1 T. brucei spp.-specific protein [Trypanosoma brucei gambiense DAL972]